MKYPMKITYKVSIQHISSHEEKYEICVAGMKQSISNAKRKFPAEKILVSLIVRNQFLGYA